MWNEPTAKQLAALPKMGHWDSKEVPTKDQLVSMHFFLGGCDWYVTEYDPASMEFFGFAILNGDFEMSEWGYFSLPELVGIKVHGGLEIDRDLHWKVRKCSEVDDIVKGCTWMMEVA
jgi:hypothetical protein